jgi:S1-C subfamily serine protease
LKGILAKIRPEPAREPLAASKGLCALRPTTGLVNAGGGNLAWASCQIYRVGEKRDREGAIRTVVILIALAGFMYVSPSHLSAQQNSQLTADRYAEVFAFCEAVKNTPEFSNDPRYVGENPPRVVISAMKAEDVVWRCQDGEVYGCETGASGRNCRQVTSIKTPDKDVKEFCAKNPNSSFVPMAVNYTASSWRCRGRVPIREETYPVDEHGYMSGAWEKISRQMGSAPEKITRQTPAILREEPPPAKADIAASGTAFAINQLGDFLTNYHVVKGCASVRLKIAAVRRDVTVIASDERNDLAVVRAQGSSFPLLYLRDGRPIRPADPVVALGFPYAGLLATSPQVTTGAVSALPERETTRVISSLLRPFSRETVAAHYWI